jgi:hypothetical protein
MAWGGTQNAGRIFFWWGGIGNAVPYTKSPYTIGKLRL